MNDFLQNYVYPYSGLVFIIIFWIYIRFKMKSSKQIQEDNQIEMLNLLDEIKEELKKLNKFNENSKNSNYRL